jgi:hypothetical protein
VSRSEANHSTRGHDLAQIDFSIATVIIKEDSFVLILLYPVETFRESSRRIDTIRQLYKAQFQQESVLRFDERWAARVSF